MTVFVLLAISFLLLPVPLDLIALQMSEFGTLKFLINIFTHQLGHGGLGHLMGNYMFMIPYAIYLESRLGRKGFLAFYFACGILAAGSQVLGAQSGGLIGSSGAAFGVFAGACALFDRALWQRVVGFLLLGFALMLQFIIATNPLSAFMGVAYWAHFGGGVGGMALVHFFVKPYFLKESQTSSPQSKSLSKKASLPS